MRITYKNYPMDIILCITWSTLLLPIALLNIEGAIRIILGLPFILFIPGYILIMALFPTKKTDQGIDTIERAALSFGLSIAIIPLIGLALNYTPWGIRLTSILLSIFIFIIAIGTIAIYRWKKTKPQQRFIINLNLTLPKHENKLDQALTIILILSIIIAAASLVYAIITPKTGEKFTEFYILGSTRKADHYPKNLSLGENATVVIGVVNHEYQTINYTVEIWLVNQTNVYNQSTQENETMYKHAWYMDKINIMLNHTPVDIEDLWMPQWEYNYSFNINKIGKHLKLMFLLFTTSTETYSHNIDYNNIIEEKINNAYQETHLFITVT